MDWTKDVTGQMMLDIKIAAEQVVGRRCTVRQLVVTPYKFEIEFDPGDNG